MSQQKKQSLWRWICMRILALAMGSVVLIALCMWLRFVIQKYWVLHHMPASQRAELAVLFQHPERDIARFHQLVDAGWGISYSMPDIGSSDWLMLAALIVIALPIIMIFGLRVARPLSEQFSRLAAAARSVARGEFGTRAGTVENAPRNSRSLPTILILCLSSLNVTIVSCAPPMSPWLTSCVRL
ncbi:hypothetical protein ERHA55_38130 [Erwinia rhapontici]|nr:hypothetical protein ERHA55_38130 [Erwinia rhapontici]